MNGPSSITDNSVTWPTLEQVGRVLALQDHNTRVVVLGATMLGLAAGVVGTFMLLRKRALVGDALSHATLPGIAGAFILMEMLGRDGKSLPVLLAGATLTAVLGMGMVLLIRRWTRLKEDAALGIVLSVFFGAGVAMLGLIQKMSTGNAAGLQGFIYGKTASMLESDALLIAGAALAATLICAALFKEFAIVCFDPGFAAARGWPVLLIDSVMMALVILVTVIGLQAVGLILVIALLVIPPAAARFWTHRLGVTVVAAGAVGGVSGWLGASLSALVPRLPAGAIIVLVAGAVFIVSMLLGPARGVVFHFLRQRELDATVAMQNLLRAMYEAVEAGQASEVDVAMGTATTVPLTRLQSARSWTPRQLARALAAAQRGGLVAAADGHSHRLTLLGLNEARRVVRNHRLWEVFLVTRADVAPAQVDRVADRIEHVLGPDLVRELEAALEFGAVPGGGRGVPRSLPGVQ